MEKEKKGTGLGIVPEGHQPLNAGMDGKVGSHSENMASEPSIACYHYRILAKSALGRKISDYLRVCSDAEEQADAFASMYGAHSYIMPPDVEAGGVGVLEFTDAAAVERLLKKGWRISMRPDKETLWLVPDVSEDATLVIAGSDEHQRLLEQQKTDVRVLVLSTKLNFLGARAILTRYELAELAGVELVPLAVSGDAVVSPRLPSGKRLSGEERVRRLQEQMKPIREAEDRRIECALYDKDFVSVVSLEGSDKAVAAYRRMMSIPVVPAGTLNGILGIGNNGVVPPCFMRGESYYLMTYEPMRSLDAKAIKERTYKNARWEVMSGNADNRSEESHDR